MNKVRYNAARLIQRQQYKDCVCEWCKESHDHSYGSGRFCSKECRDAYVGSKNSSNKSQRVKEHLDQLRHDGKIAPKAEYGRWKCLVCNKIFETQAELKQHIQVEHHVKQPLIKNGKAICPYCGKAYDNKQQLGGHIANCKLHPQKLLHELGHIKTAKVIANKIKAGLIQPSFKGRHHSKETREKISKRRAEQVVNEFLPKEWVHIKWYKVKNLKGEEFSVRGTWEVNVAKRLNNLGIYWIKAKPIAYKSDIIRHYTPDFYLPLTNEYIEVKGRYTDADKLKMKLVVEQHPGIRIYFLLQQLYYDFIDGTIFLSDDLIFDNRNFKGAYSNFNMVC